MPRAGDDAPAAARLTGAMELLAAVLAGPLGYLVRSTRRSLLGYLLVWAVIFPVQTALVHYDADPAGNDPGYWAANAVILVFGIGCNRLGALLARRRGRYAAA